MQDQLPLNNDTTFASRRAAVKDIAGIAGKFALAGLPFFLSAMPKKAKAQTTTNVIDTLNYYLLLTYMYEELYVKALASPDLQVTMDGNNRLTAEALGDQAAAQVISLENKITALSGTPITKPTFDWTGGANTGGPGVGLGPMQPPHSPFDDLSVFFAVAQMLSDMMVRAYKAQLYTLMNHNDAMTMAMQLQSTIARHAAHIRRMRRINGLAVPPGVELKPWITKSESGINAPYAFIADKVYNTEGETDQDQVDLLLATGHTHAIVSEAFDEHLAQSDVESILDYFLV